MQGVTDKSQALDRLLQRLSLTDTQVACIGDDTPDVPLFVRVALAVAVQRRASAGGARRALPHHAARRPRRRA